MKIKTALKIAGIVLTILGFLGRNADKLPVAAAIFAGNYVRALRGIETIKSEKTALKPGDPGFLEITKILRAKLEPRERAQGANFLQIVRTGNRGMTGAPLLRMFAEIEIFIAGNPPLKGDLVVLEEEVNALLSKRTFFWFSLFFWFGICLNAIGVIADLREGTARGGGAEQAVCTVEKSSDDFWG